MEDHDFAIHVPEDEDVAVAEVTFLNGLFQGHSVQRNGLRGAFEVDLSGLSYRGVLMNDHRNSRDFRQAYCGLDLMLGRFAVPLLVRLTFLRNDPRLVLE